MPRQRYFQPRYISDWCRWKTSGLWLRSSKATMPTWYCQNQHCQGWDGPEPDIVITSDASLLGWGAECLRQTTQGGWYQTEMLQHINVLELRAAELALKSFKDLWEGSRVRLQLDNTTAVSRQHQAHISLSPFTSSWYMKYESLFFFGVWFELLSGGVVIHSGEECTMGGAGFSDDDVDTGLSGGRVTSPDMALSWDLGSIGEIPWHL